MTTCTVPQRQEYTALVALSLLAVLLRLPSLEQPFDNDSGAIAYHARRIVRGEPLYGVHHPAHHMPAVYYVYALAFTLFGDSVWAVKFFLLPWTALTVYLAYCLGRLLVGREMGLLAAVFYAFLSSDVWLFGSSAEIEVFANLPRIAAPLIAVSLARRGARSWRFLFVGLVSGIAVLFKVVYLSPLAMTGLVLLLDVWRNKGSFASWQRAIRGSLWTGLGLALALAVTVGYFWSQGLLSRFLLVLTIGRGYVAMRNAASSFLAYTFLYPLGVLTSRNVVLVVCAVAGWVGVFLEQYRAIRARNKAILSQMFVVLWLLLALIEAGFSRVAFPHYYQLVIPPLAVLAAWFVHRIAGVLRAQYPKGATVLAVLSVAAVVGVSLGQNAHYYTTYARYKLGLGTYEDFVQYGWHRAMGEEFIRVQELADYVREHTLPTDRIYYWSGGVQIYYLADRLCPIDIIWPIYAEATGPYQRIFGEQTRYVILGESNNIPRPAWLYDGLAQQYVLETTIRGQEVYRRID